MRELTGHKVNGLNEKLQISVLDEPGQGNASHRYSIMPMIGDGTLDNPSEVATPCEIHFQNGPIQEVGVNGISNESLIEVVIDRMRGFQSGQYACRDNAVALTKLEEAMMWLQKRTRDRMARGVEGINKI